MAAALPVLCRALCAAISSGGQQLACWILAEQWAWLLEDLQALCENVPQKGLRHEALRDHQGDGAAVAEDLSEL